MFLFVSQQYQPQLTLNPIFPSLYLDPELLFFSLFFYFNTILATCLKHAGKRRVIANQ